MSDELNLYPQAAVGYRAWNVFGDPDWLAFPEHWPSRAHREHYRLRSIGLGLYDWRSGLNVAECSSTHSAPQSECSCGLYCYHELGPALDGERFGNMVGAILCAGRVEIHADGMRAEKAAICALLSPPGRARKRMAARVAAEYGVPLFRSPRRLRAYAEGLGTKAPAQERPEPAGGAPRYRPAPAWVEGIYRHTLWLWVVAFFTVVMGIILGFVALAEVASSGIGAASDLFPEVATAVIGGLAAMWAVDRLERRVIGY